MNIGIDGRLQEQTGVGRYTRNLYKCLQSLDKKNHYYLFNPKIKWHSFKEQLVLPFWLLNKKFDLVHFTYFSMPIFYPKKFVLTIHDLIPWDYKTGQASTLPFFLYNIKHFFYKLVVWLTTHRAEKIIAVSRATRDQIIAKLKINPDKIQVIYQGVEEKFHKDGFNKLTDPRILKNKYFLYVGNAYPHKNLEILIQAFDLIISNKKYQDYQLVLAGPDDFFYQRLKSKMKTHKKIIFGQIKSDDDLITYYKNAALFITPALIEGFGLPVVEAMACQCPVVCSDIPVFREIYGQAPVFFKPKDKEAIAQAIIKVIDNPAKRQSMITLGKKVSRNYSWEICARKTLEVYENSYCL